MWAFSSELPHELRRICANIPSIPLSVDTTLTHTCIQWLHTPTHCLHYLLLSPEGPRAGTTQLIAPSLGKWSSSEWRRTQDSWRLQPRTLWLFNELKQIKSLRKKLLNNLYVTKTQCFHLKEHADENMTCVSSHCELFAFVRGFWLVWGISTHCSSRNTVRSWSDKCDHHINLKLPE